MRKVFALLIAVIFMACGAEKAADTSLTEKQLLDSLNFTLTALQGDVGAVEIVNYSEEQLEYAELLLANYPKSPALSNWLFEGGKAGRTSGEYERGVKLFEAYLEQEDRPKAAEAIFLTAFIYDEDLKEKEKAEKLYKQLLAEYPEHELADDAQALLEQLYMTETEIIEMLMKKQQETAQE